MSNKGFTLIELLVVIAIIGILSSVVLASLNTARSKARVSKARAELQQIRSALEIRFSDVGLYPGGGTVSLCDNGNEVPIDASSGIGPYFGGGVPFDPWGRVYYTDGDYQCNLATAGCTSTDSGATSGVLLSRGPDGAISYGAGDDIVFHWCRR